jgi:hypothetical protein
MLVSLFLGALTHIAWDAFTHANGWIVTHLPALQEHVMLSSRFDKIFWPIYRVLQHFSTLLGTLVLIISYVSWLRRVQPTDLQTTTKLDHWRVVLLSTMVVAAIFFAASLALLQSQTQGHLVWNVFIFRSLILATNIFFILFLTAVLLIALVRGRLSVH